MGVVRLCIAGEEAKHLPEGEVGITHSRLGVSLTDVHHQVLAGLLGPAGEISQQAFFAYFVMDSPRIIPHSGVEVCGSGMTGPRRHRRRPYPRDAARTGVSTEAPSAHRAPVKDGKEKDAIERPGMSRLSPDSPPKPDPEGRVTEKISNDSPKSAIAQILGIIANRSARIERLEPSLITFSDYLR